MKQLLLTERLREQLSARIDKSSRQIKWNKLLIKVPQQYFMARSLIADGDIDGFFIVSVP